MARMHVAALAGVLTAALSDASNLCAQNAEQEIAKVEQTRVVARQKGDSATLARITADDFTQIVAQGQLVRKKDILDLAAAPRIGVRDLKTRFHGDVAVVTGTQSGAANNAQGSRFTHVWQRRNGQWVAVFIHNTPMVADLPSPDPKATPKTLSPTSWPKPANQEEQAVVEASRLLDDTYERKNVAGYSAITAANWVRINADGSEGSREEFLKLVAGTPEQKRTTPHLGEFHVRIYGSIAVLTYRQYAAVGYDVLRSRVFVKDGGRWKQLISQMTPVGQS